MSYECKDREDCKYYDMCIRRIHEEDCSVECSTYSKERVSFFDAVTLYSIFSDKVDYSNLMKLEKNIVEDFLLFYSGSSVADITPMYNKAKTIFDKHFKPEIGEV